MNVEATASEADSEKYYDRIQGAERLKLFGQIPHRARSSDLNDEGIRTGVELSDVRLGDRIDHPQGPKFIVQSLQNLLEYPKKRI